MEMTRGSDGLPDPNPNSAAHLHAALRGELRSAGHDLRQAGVLLQKRVPGAFSFFFSFFFFLSKVGLKGKPQGKAEFWG